MEAALRRLPKSKLRYRVLQLDMIRAASWAGYRYFHDWPALAPDDQAYLIAAYQLDQELRLLQEHEAAQAIRRARKQKPS